MKFEPSFEYKMARLFGMDVDASWSMNHHAPLWNGCRWLHINWWSWPPRCHHPSINHWEERKTTTTASKDDNKRKYADDGTEEEAEEAPSKKQKTIGNNNGDNGDENGDDDNSNNDDNSSSTDDYSSEPKEEVSSEKVEMNLPTSFEEELLIWWGRFDNEDTFDGEEESPFFSDDD
jgi:hypothetical protein